MDNCFIDGGSLASVIRFEGNAYIDSTTVIKGFTIQNGYAHGNNQHMHGGGIYISYSSPTLIDMSFSGNSASSRGGGIYIYASSINGSYLLINNNNSEGHGGGIFISATSDIHLNKSTISSNIVGQGDTYGAGIYADGGTATLINSIVYYNRREGEYGINYNLNGYTMDILNEYTVSYSDIEGEQDWLPEGEGNISIAPEVIDFENEDFSLQPSSPCIDAGAPDYPLDPDGTIPDMGAYYFNQLSSCDVGYTEIDDECYYQSDLDVLQQFIDNSQGGFMPPPSDMSPIDVGVQEWEDGRIVFLCYSYIGESECYIYDYILSGPIPPDIGNLVELRHLILSWSQLGGQIPSSIGNLTNLTELKLHYNHLSGEIPPGIGNLTNLTDLYLRENELTGEIPPGIWNLVNLDRLFLEYNNLSGEIPESFSNLINLRYCSFQHNQLSGQIPQSIGNFEIMIGLHLAHNQFSGMVPDGICNLVENSNFIYLYGNQLCPPYPECLSDEQINGPWLPGGGEENEQDISECEGCCYEEYLANENCDGGSCFVPQCTEDCEWEPMQCWGSIGYCWCVDENGIEIEGTSQPSWEGFPDCEEINLGDINDDGEINILDIVIAANMVLADEYDEVADVNEDGELNILDLVSLVNLVLFGDDNVAIEWVTIPAGSYTYGEGDEIRTIDYDYQVSKYEITNDQYMAYLEDAFSSDNIIVILGTVMGYYTGDEENAAGDYVYLDLADEHCRIIHDGFSFSIVDGYEDHPVVEISWFGANAFAEYYGWRLPDEYEWEKAARGNTGYNYPFGNSMNGSQANYYDSGDPYEHGEWLDWPNTSPVGFYNGQNYEDFVTSDSPSPYGAYDMAGNVWEYTGSWYFAGSPLRVRRGGSWYVGLTSGWCRSWLRDGNYPSGTYYDIGFRIARTN